MYGMGQHAMLDRHKQAIIVINLFQFNCHAYTQRMLSYRFGSLPTQGIRVCCWTGCAGLRHGLMLYIDVSPIEKCHSMIKLNYNKYNWIHNLGPASFCCCWFVTITQLVYPYGHNVPMEKAAMVNDVLSPPMNRLNSKLFWSWIQWK